jgi:hypothetical protein
MLYRATTRPSRPAAPARLIATLPVAMGAPPVEVDEAAVAEAEAELEPVEAEAESESDLDLAEVAVVSAAESVLAAPVEEASATVFALATAVVVESASAAVVAAAVAAATLKRSAVLAHSLTLAGSLLYQAGIVPASMSAIILDSEVGLARSSYHEAGMAVSRTVKMELGTLA